MKLNTAKKNLRLLLNKPLRTWSEEQREAMAVTIEKELPEWLREAFGVEVESVFDLTSVSTLISYRNMIASNEEAKRIDAESAGRFDHALKLYRDFLDSKFNPLKKKPKAVKGLDKGLEGLEGLGSLGGLDGLEREALNNLNGEAINSLNGEAINREAINFTEGAIVQQTVDRRERNPQARQACIERYGCKCVVCGFDFESIYGDVGRGYIEVHHLKPISQIDDEHEVTAEDLVPLCANCHAMAHRRSPEPFTPTELKEMMNG